MLNIVKNKNDNKIYELLDNNIFLDDNFERILPNTTDASEEKHIPVVVKNGNKLNIKINHPITDEHYIKYIFVTYGDTIIKKELVNSNETCIYINEDIENFDVYSYCNIHGLWMIKN